MVAEEYFALTANRRDEIAGVIARYILRIADRKRHDLVPARFKLTLDIEQIALGPTRYEIAIVSDENAHLYHHLASRPLPYEQLATRPRNARDPCLCRALKKFVALQQKWPATSPNRLRRNCAARRSDLGAD